MRAHTRPLVTDIDLNELYVDAMVLDMNMPGLGGQGTLPLLRRRHPDLPVFLATGRVDQATLELARAYPSVTLVPKPFSMRDLKEHLDAVAADRFAR